MSSPSRSGPECRPAVPTGLPVPARALREPTAPRRPPRSTPSTPRTFGLVVLLGSLAALGAITIDLYLPSLPEVARDLGTTASGAQLTVTCMLVGMGLGQLVVGPLSDRYGRRPPVLIGFGLYVVASLLCLVAPNLPVLVALRLLQGMGVSAGAVTAMAVVRDLFTGAVASRLMSRLVLVIGVAPLLAPTVGGALAGVLGWRSVFGLLALAGVVMLLTVWHRLPETRQPAPDGAVAPAARLRVGEVLTGYGRLLRDGRFLPFALLPGLSMAIIICYVSVSPFVLQETYGLTPQQFAIAFALNGVALVGGAQLNAALVSRCSPVALLCAAVPATVVTATVLLVVVLTGAGGLPGFMVVLWVLLGLGGLVQPNAVTLALAEQGRRAGAASALITATQSGVGGGIAIVAGVLGGDAAAMATVMLAATLVSATLLSAGLYRRRARVAVS